MVPDDIPDEATYVYLRGNKISSIKTSMFLHLTKCTELDLSNNSISKIEPGAFKGLKNLEILDISRNQLTWLNVDTFSGLYSLELLNLHSNGLVTLTLGVFRDFPRPFKLNLAKNPFRCNSSLCWLKEENNKGTVKWDVNGILQCTNCCPSRSWWGLTDFCAKGGMNI